MHIIKHDVNYINEIIIENEKLNKSTMHQYASKLNDEYQIFIENLNKILNEKRKGKI